MNQLEPYFAVMEVCKKYKGVFIVLTLEIILSNVSYAQYNIIDTITTLNNFYSSNQFISRSGNILAISHDWQFSGLSKNGVVDIYKKDIKWKLIDKITLPESMPEQEFGTSVAINEHFLIVGAPKWDTIVPDLKAIDRGKVYIYLNKGGKYTFQQILSGSYELPNELFGSKLLLNDSTLYVSSPGAYYRNGFGKNQINAGAISIYKYTANKFVFSQELRSPDPSIYGHLGLQFNLCSNNLIVSATNKTSFMGIVFIYQQMDGKWVLKDSLKANKSLGYEQFGDCMSCYKDLLAISAPNFEGYNVQKGRVFIYKKDKNDWLLDQIIQSNNPYKFEHFGNTVLLNENDILIGNRPVERNFNPPTTTVKSSSRYNIYKTSQKDTILFNNVFLLPQYDSTGLLIKADLQPPFASSIVMEFAGTNPDITHFNIQLLKNGKITNQKKLEPKFNFKVCRDGSTSSLFKVVEQGNKNHLVFRIKEAAQNRDSNRYGKLIPYLKLADTLWYLYKHPEYIASSRKYSESLTLQLYDTITQQVLKSGPLEILNVPVMMVHGIWSYPSSFNTMEMSLINSGLYDLKLLHKVDYETTNARGFISNKLVVPNNLKLFKANLIEAGISVGKFDIVTHSMGGILTRSYLQSLLYKEDIHKLIGLNVPHSGSALCNYILESPKLAFSLNLLRFATNKGGVEDFKVKSFALDRIINGPTFLNLNIIPSHSIVTRVQRLIPAEGNRVIYQTGIINALLGTDFVRKLHGEDNDEVVALSSQGGGLNQANITQIDGYVHLGSASKSTLIDTVLNLLQLPVTSPKFSINGFHPVELFYNRIFIPDPSRMSFRDNNKPNVSILNTTTDIHNTDTVYFATQLPRGYTSLKLTLVDPSGNFFSGESDKVLDTLIWVDKGSALGLFKILLIGSTVSDPLAYIDTTLSILIKPDNPFSDIYTEAEEFQMSTGESKTIHVFAHDSSGNMFEITSLPGLTIGVENESLLYDSLSKQIHTLKAGVTTVYFSYGKLVSNEMIIHITEPQVLPFLIRESITQPVCGTANGTIDLHIEGTYPPFEYLWSDSSTSAQRNGLTPGFYEVRITDHEGNTDTKEYYLESQDNPPFTDLWPNKDTIIDRGNVFTLSAYGGTRYQWSTGDTTSSINVYKEGMYSVFVETESGCNITDSINVSCKGHKRTVEFDGVPKDIKVDFDSISEQIQITPKDIRDRFQKMTLLYESGKEIPIDSTWKMKFDETKIILSCKSLLPGEYQLNLRFGFKKFWSVRNKTFTISIK